MKKGAFGQMHSGMRWKETQSKCSFPILGPVKENKSGPAQTGNIFSFLINGGRSTN